MQAPSRLDAEPVAGLPTPPTGCLPACWRPRMTCGGAREAPANTAVSRGTVAAADARLSLARHSNLIGVNLGLAGLGRSTYNAYVILGPGLKIPIGQCVSIM